jgi:hypothetical protein
MAEDDIESYWDEIRPLRELNDPLAVVLSEEDVSPATAEEQFQRAQELSIHPVPRTSLRNRPFHLEAPQSYPTVRPMILSQQTYDDLRAWHAPDLPFIERSATLADGILNDRNPQSFHEIEDTVPLRDLQLALQTLGYACETWVNEEGRLCIQFHGLDEQSWGTRCVGGELRVTIWNPHALR